MRYFFIIFFAVAVVLGADPWEAATLHCPETGGIDPRCVRAVSNGELAYDSIVYGPQPTPASMADCPLCATGSVVLSVVESNSITLDATPMFRSSNNAVNLLAMYFSTNAVFTNAIMPGTPSNLTQVVQYDTNSVCLTAQVGTNLTKLVGGHVGTSVDVFLGLTNWPDTVLREVAVDQEAARQALASFKAGVGGSNAFQEASWSNVLSYASNVLVYAYMDGTNSVTSNMVQYVTHWGSNFLANSRGWEEDFRKGPSNYPAYTAQSVEVSGRTWFWIDHEPTAEEVRDQNLVVKIVTTNSITKAAGNVYYIDGDPLATNWMRVVARVIYVFLGWYLVYWGLDQKYAAWQEGWKAFLAGQTAAGTGTLLAPGGVLLGKASNWVTNSLIRLFSAGTAAIAALTVLSLLSAVWSTWRLWISLSPVQTGYWDPGSLTIASIALSTETTVAVEAGSMMNSLITVGLYVFPLGTALAVLTELWVFRASLTSLVTVSYLRSAAIGGSRAFPMKG